MGEKQMNRTKSFLIVGAFSLLVMALPAVASAQWGGNNRNDDIWNGGGRYGNIRGTVQSLENRARNFDREVNRVDNRRDARYDRYDRIDNLDQLSTRFKNAAGNLADAYGRGRNMNNSRDEAQRVLSLGSQIDQLMYNLSRNTGRNRNNDRSYLVSDWKQIDSDLKSISRAYGLNYQSRNGSWRDKLPF